MRMTRLVVVVLGVVLAAFALSGCGGDDDEGATDTETTTETTTATGADGTTLAASVGPGFVISLTMANGDEIAALPPGTYTIEVNDQSAQHNFHLTGAGVDETTDVAEIGEQSWEITLEAGTYTYVCDPHASTMTGSFEVSG